jgi:nitrogen-specific signal transduction histidine kinase
LQGQLSQAQKMESIGTLAGGIAHDFNNLLTVIIGQSELILQNMKESDIFYKDLQAVVNAGKNAEKLTRQLLTFSRKQVYEPRIISINETILNLDKMMKRLIGEDIQIITHLKKGLPNIKADPSQIEQVMINLLINSRDAIQDEQFQPVNKIITIETGKILIDRTFLENHQGAKEGWHIFFMVSDTGTGMDQGIKSKIFEPFFTTKAVGKGTGLGMSTVYGIVKQNQGYIYVYSEIKKGTSVKIYWPVTEEEIPYHTTLSGIDKSPKGLESILLVEDDSAVRDFTSMALKSLGYQVYEACDGSQAISVIKKNNTKIDLVMTDIVMPGMNGLQLSSELSSLAPYIKILFTSGYTDNHLVNKGMVNNDLNFLSKPYSTQTLALKIRDILNS